MKQAKSICGVMLFSDKKLKASVKINFSSPVNENYEEWYGTGTWIGENTSQQTTIALMGTYQNTNFGEIYICGLMPHNTFEFKGTGNIKLDF